MPPIIAGANCATALKGARTDGSTPPLTPAKGTTICLVAFPVEPTYPKPKLVALEVTAVDPATGAVTLAASAWTGR